MKMRSRVFIDTNVLIYAADAADPEKQAIAQEVVRNLRRTGAGVISTQVMQEFFATLMKKLRFSSLDAKRLTMTLTSFEVVSMHPGLVEAAMDLTILEQLSFWDALLLAAAREARCPTLLTEDLPGKAQVAGITFVSPF
jgi:predicted nucleic acid-binding protein